MSDAASWAWAASAPMRGALAAGAVAGVISAGVGARVVMRTIALANPDRDGVNTNAEATVGDITLGGTVGLLMLGLFAGLLGGAVYLGLRRWLPVPVAWRGLAYGVVTLLTVGHQLFDTTNADFQIFEPIVMVIALFAALFLLNGVIVAKLADRFHPEPTYPASQMVSRVVTGVMLVICAFGLIGLADTITQMLDDEGSCFSAAGAGQGCAVRTSNVAP